MPRTGLIIRNIDGIQRDDLKTALEGLESNPQAPQEFNELLGLIQSSTLSENNDLNQALALFKRQKVRDYIYETVKAKTGNHVIYHLNGLDDNGRTNNSNVTYITEKLENIHPNTDFDIVYLGGGHGDPVLGSSNLSQKQLKSITDTLNDKNVQCSAVILGSCFSTAYAGLYQPLLKNNGVIISNSLECGGDNNFHQVMEWMKEQRQEFYSDEDINSSIKVSREARSAIRRVLEGTVPHGEMLREEYNAILNAYRQSARTQFPQASENQIYDMGGYLLNTDLDQFIIEMQSTKAPLHKEIIQQILIKYPLLNEHIKVISNKRGEQVIFDALINSLHPTPTSLVVGTSQALTMFNFGNANEMPPNASEDFQDNYLAVLRQVTRSGRFSKISEVTQHFDGVSAKRQFNKLFAQATLEMKLDPVELQNQEEQLKREKEQPKEKQQNNISEGKLKESLQKIDKILSELDSKIGKVDQHNFDKTHKVAATLLEELNTARNNYEMNLNGSQVTPEQAGATFKEECRTAINKAKPVLEKDLGWGDYLTNLLKTLANAVVWAVTLCKVNSFFPYARSQSVEAAEKAENELLQQPGSSSK